MTDASPFISDHRAQAARLSMIRTGLRRQSRADTGPSSQAPIQSCGYYGLKMYDGATKPSGVFPDQAKTVPRPRLEWLLGFTLQQQTDRVV